MEIISIYPISPCWHVLIVFLPGSLSISCRPWFVGFLGKSFDIRRTKFSHPMVFFKTDMQLLIKLRFSLHLRSNARKFALISFRDKSSIFSIAGLITSNEG